MKLVIPAFLSILLVTSSAFAQEGVVQNRDGRFDSVLYQQYTQSLENLRTRSAQASAEIKEILDCYASGRLYNSGGCSAVYAPEQDPNSATHAKRELVGSTCAGANQVQIFNTGSNTWTCKGIRRVQSSPVL